MNRYNLFHHFTQASSHAAVWAWIFQATDADGEEMAGPKDVGQSALRLLDGPTPPGGVDVETQLFFATRDHPDLRVDFGDGHSLFVEVKKEEEFRSSQIERYREAIDDENRIALISTQFDADRAEGVCPFLGLEDIRELLWPHRDTHSLLSDYADWADERKEKWITIQRTVFSEDHDAVASALSTLYGQTRVVGAVAESMAGRISYANASRGGDPSTEFQFVDADEDQDALFYRVDAYAEGYHVSLKQYLDGQDEPAWDGKEDRLARLRAWWTSAAEETDHRLTFQPPHNNGSKTREVACLLFKENLPSVVAEDLPKIHRAFVESLNENGWTLRDNEP